VSLPPGGRSSDGTKSPGSTQAGAGLRLPLPPVEPVTEARILARLEQVVRERAPRTPRRRGEALALGDEARVDVRGVVRGRALPLTAAVDLVVPVTPDPLFPGLWEGVARTPLGRELEVHVVLPVSYPDERLRKSNAVFHLVVREAFRLDVPELHSPDFLRMLDLGTTLPEAMAAIAVELEAESQAQRARVARAEVAAALAVREGLRISPGQVDAQLSLRWAEGLGATLERLGVSAGERDAAKAEWLREPALRFETERALASQGALTAIATRENLVIPPEVRARYLTQLLAASGLTAESAGAALDARPGLRARLEAQIRQEALLDLLVSRVEFFTGHEKPFEKPM